MSSFAPGSAVLPLTADAVQVWYTSLDGPAPRVAGLRQTLTADERARADRFRFERDRTRWIVARGVLRALLGHYLNVDPREPRLTYGRYGKPSVVTRPEAADLQFNLSHSDDLAVYAFARRRQLGVDVERIRPVPELASISEHFFSPTENATLGGLPPDERLRGFFTCWTRKEAFIKATGDGLAHPLDRFDVSLAPGEPAALLRLDGSRWLASDWSLAALTVPDGYVGALAVLGHGWTLTCQAWPA